MGAHKFYLGRTLEGIGYLIFCALLSALFALPNLIPYAIGLDLVALTIDLFTLAKQVDKANQAR
jgi:TM2 domain-containing membrane protein YozV